MTSKEPDWRENIKDAFSVLPPNAHRGHDVDSNDFCNDCMLFVDADYDSEAFMDGARASRENRIAIEAEASRPPRWHDCSGNYSRGWQDGRTYERRFGSRPPASGDALREVGDGYEIRTWVKHEPSDVVVLKGHTQLGGRYCLTDGGDWPCAAVRNALTAIPPDPPASEDALREALAAIEHDQWIEWSRTIAAEGLTPERITRWQRYWVPYADLDEPTKDHDRKWADKVLDALAATPPERSGLAQAIDRICYVLDNDEGAAEMFEAARDLYRAARLSSGGEDR